VSDELKIVLMKILVLQQSAFLRIANLHVQQSIEAKQAELEGLARESKEAQALIQQIMGW